MPQPERKKLYAMRMEPTLYAALTRRAQKIGVPTAVLIRMIVRGYLEKRQR